MKKKRQDILHKKNVRQSLPQKKSLGQVFLQSQAPIDCIISALQHAGVSRVLEIGPGAGALTFSLLKHGFQVDAVEKDERFAQLLQEKQSTVSEGKNLRVIPGDILEFDLPRWLEAQPNIKTAVVGNIPYNISTPIVMWALAHIQQVTLAVFMVQWEFAARMASAAGSKTYGSLSVFVQLRACAEFLLKVPRQLFNPVPEVDSAIVKLSPLETVTEQELLRKTEIITRAAFMHRRKKLRNGIKPWLKNTEDVEKLGINLDARPETLRPEQFVALARVLFSSHL